MLEYRNQFRYMTFKRLKLGAKTGPHPIMCREQEPLHKRQRMRIYFKFVSIEMMLLSRKLFCLNSMQTYSEIMEIATTLSWFLDMDICTAGERGDRGGNIGQRR